MKLAVGRGFGDRRHGHLAAIIGGVRRTGAAITLKCFRGAICRNERGRLPF